MIEGKVKSKLCARHGGERAEGTGGYHQRRLHSAFAHHHFRREREALAGMKLMFSRLDIPFSQTCNSQPYGMHGVERSAPLRVPLTYLVHAGGK